MAAHALLTTPFVLRLVMASLAEFDPAIEEAARNLGAGLRADLVSDHAAPDPAGDACRRGLRLHHLVRRTRRHALPGGAADQTLPIRIFTYVEFASDPSISAISRP